MMEDEKKYSPSISRLPEPTIQLIHSFLTSKEAALTTILSKSWHSAWLTRPNLDFDHKTDFARSRRMYAFSNHAEKTLSRYENSNMRIESFRLCFDYQWYTNIHHNTTFIVRALKLGATRLTLYMNSYNFVLRNEVFGSDNLSALTVGFCEIDLGINREVRCRRLVSLSLEHVEIKSHDMLFHIISSCPLIEELKLCHIYGDRDAVGDAQPTLRRLRSLVLDHVYFDTSFTCDLSSKFPSLKDLTLCLTSIGKAGEEMLISSPSLLCLNFKITRYACGYSNPCQRVKFDVPSIRKLTFEVSTIHSPCVGSNSVGWECDASVTDQRKRLSANNIDFLGETFLQGLGVEISTLSQLMYGSNDLKEARAQCFDEAASKWKNVLLLDNSVIPEGGRRVRFRLIWQPKQKIY